REANAPGKLLIIANLLGNQTNQLFLFHDGSPFLGHVHAVAGIHESEDTKCLFVRVIPGHKDFKRFLRQIEAVVNTRCRVRNTGERLVKMDELSFAGRRKTGGFFSTRCLQTGSQYKQPRAS
ncbi:MAG: hypothetical protein ABSF60_11785, partial [Verrucomicrobiota bacterium]